VNLNYTTLGSCAVVAIRFERGEDPTQLALLRRVFILIRIVEGGVQAGSTRHVGHFWPIVPVPGDCEDGEFGGMKIGRGNRNTRRKPASAPLCPLQISLAQTRA
jgi:hypothetical protein